jgi:gamma-glutamylcyclotransferase (GGCT)/AIG2-like uncharacterized protein YtfP
MPANKRRQLRGAWMALAIVGAGLILVVAIVFAFHATGVSADWLSATADLAMALGTGFAAIWAVVSYRSAKRSEKSRWMKELFSEFFFNNNFDEIRDLLEFGYATKLEPLLYQAALGRYNEIDTEEERRLVKELDNFLNYMEYVLYLEDNNQISRDDVEVTFGYWIGVLADDQHALLRDYCDKFGYERVSALVGERRRTLPAPTARLFAVYGSLLTGQAPHAQFKLGTRAHKLGACQIPGRLLDLGDYPGLIRDISGPSVIGELYSTTDSTLVTDLDAYEVFQPGDFDRSEYQRIIVPLIEPRTDAWVYYYIGPRDGFAEISDGDWLAAQQRKIS